MITTTINIIIAGLLIVALLMTIHAAILSHKLKAANERSTAFENGLKHTSKERDHWKAVADEQLTELNELKDANRNWREQNLRIRQIVKADPNEATEDEVERLVNKQQTVLVRRRVRAEKLIAAAEKVRDRGTISKANWEALQAALTEARKGGEA